MPRTFDHRFAEIEGVEAARLSDPDGLAALVVAAASASGISAPRLPVIQLGPQGHAVGLVCLDGHLVLHANPSRGDCTVDIAVRIPASADRGLEVILRRLGAVLTHAHPPSI
jgi:S-adenosylmethionine/arginine decarboxylase-like enzyme